VITPARATWRETLTLGLALLLALATTGLLTAQLTYAGVVTSPKTPRAFADTAYAQLASDGEQHLWLLSAGFRKRQFRLALHERGPGSWRVVAAPPQTPSDAAPVNVASNPRTFEPQPCLGFTDAQTRVPLITCHSKHRWFPQQIRQLLPPRSQLVQLMTIHGRLLALFSARPRQGRSGFKVIQTTAGGGHWESGGPLLRTGPALAQLGSGSQSRGGPWIELAVETQGPRPVRSVVAVMRDGRWHRLGPAVSGVGLGPLVSGPVRNGETIAMPVNDAGRSPWAFSSFSASRGGDWKRVRLSGGFGNAQGRIDYAAGSAWASWQEDRETGSGGFEAINWVAELGADGEPLEARKLWQGRVVGPGNTQVVEADGQVQALYMRGDRRGRLVPVVVPVDPGTFRR
jgi:hypothetical protein